MAKSARVLREVRPGTMTINVTLRWGQVGVVQTQDVIYFPMSPVLDYQEAHVLEPSTAADFVIVDEPAHPIGA